MWLLLEIGFWLFVIVMGILILDNAIENFWERRYKARMRKLSEEDRPEQPLRENKHFSWAENNYYDY